MNELKHLEDRMRSWRPRRPSAKLEQRLFGKATEEPGVQALGRWLMPLAACAVIAFMALAHPSNGLNHAAFDAAEFSEMSLSNQHYASYLPGSFQCEANRLDTFKWTNRGAFPSSTFSFPPGKVNY